MDSPFYAVDPNGDSRVPLEFLTANYVWRCPTWTLARNWVFDGAQAFVGLYTLGATYSDNADTPFCLEDGVVWHRDDIYIVARYKALILSADPNVPGLGPWHPATNTNAYPKELGVKTTPDGLDPAVTCIPSFWGEAAQYDYQVFNI
ncbi:hypothetical protein B0H13DRAFT_2227305 [Mycena leptocephala]|nr:hypothetical protein B0H13DRAFT_2227305 [Mycena leptocephala]